MSMHAGSSNERLSGMALHERIYIETDVACYQADMRTLRPPRTRRPAELADRDFKVSLFTAVSASRAGDVRYLICIERTK